MTPDSVYCPTCHQTKAPEQFHRGNHTCSRCLARRRSRAARRSGEELKPAVTPAPPPIIPAAVVVAPPVSQPIQDQNITEAGVRRLLVGLLARAVDDPEFRGRDPVLRDARASAMEFLRSPEARGMASWLGVPRGLFASRVARSFGGRGETP